MSGFGKKGAEAQEASSRNDSKTLYRLVKDLMGRHDCQSVPIQDKNGNTLTTPEQQNQRWIEHFREVLNQPSPTILINLDQEVPQQLLDISTDDFNNAEIGRAIMKLKNSKAASEDQITAEMLKYGGKTFIQALGKLLNSCWQEEHLPSDWGNGVIVKIPKKGNLVNCNNWRGITILSILGKVLSILLLDRLKDAMDDRFREQQAGFRKGRSCCEQIFALRNIIEQCYEFQQQLEIIDFKKAFDSVHLDSLWKIAELYGIPTKYIDIIKNIYHNSSRYVKTQEGCTNYFGIETGVGQGYVLLPLLFLLVIDYIMH